MTVKRGKFHQPGKSNQITFNFKILNISTSAQQAHRQDTHLNACGVLSASQHSSNTPKPATQLGEALVHLFTAYTHIRTTILDSS